MLPVVIKSINQAFKVLKSFRTSKWDGDYGLAVQQALKDILEKDCISHARNLHFDQKAAQTFGEVWEKVYPRLWIV